MIIKIYNDLETKLISKVTIDGTEEIKEEFSNDGWLKMRHYIKNNTVTHSQKFNMFGDVVAHGSFLKGVLHGVGCIYNHEKHQWHKSPHFQYGSIFGLAAIFDLNHDIIFYGWMFNNEMVKEEHIYHPYLKNEFLTVQKKDPMDSIMLKQINEILDS